MASYHKYNLRRLLFLSHRYLGLFTAAFVVMLAVTGLMLNHTEQLSLDQQQIQSTQILAWYGITLPEPGPGFQAGGVWFLQYSERLFMDGSEISQQAGPLLGVVATPTLFVAAYPQALLLLGREGEVIEKLTSLPGSIRRLGSSPDGGSPILETTQGLYLADQQLLNWKPKAAGPVHWTRPMSLPRPIIQKIKASYRGEGPTLERLILDLHSGRLFGHPGVLFMDIVAITFLVLAALGVWMWARR